MNTIPTIFNDPIPSYTAVGGNQRLGSSGLSAVLLNRGGHIPRRALFQEFEKKEFDYVISVEAASGHYDLEELSGRFPFVRFILCDEKINLGEKINLAVSELQSSRSPLVFVLWNDIRLLHGGSAEKMAERLRQPEARAGDESPFIRLCTVPVIQNAAFEAMPTLMFPGFYKGEIKTLSYAPSREASPALYPFDGVGIYDTERFVRMGGFDSTIINPYWQLMDFGLRSHLWGESIASTELIRASYEGEMPAMDNTAGESYKRFYLKNLAPVFRGDYAHLPYRRFLSYLYRSGDGPFVSWDDFSEARRWVGVNRYRFTADVRLLTEKWEHPPA